MKRPNVIFVFSDQHRAQACGYAGDPNVKTPAMDRLAAEGVCFTTAISGMLSVPGHVHDRTVPASPRRVFK